MHPAATRTSISAGVPVVCVAVVAAVLFGAILQRHLSDDAYITLSYARNFAEHLHWGIVPGRTANTATSPLNVFALAALIMILPGGAAFAAGVLYVLSVTATFLAVRRLVGRDGGRSRSATAWASTVTGLVELNPIVQSSAGLEVAMFIALLAWLAVAVQVRQAVWFGVLAGALILTRPDGVLFVAVLILPFVRSVRRLLIVLTLAVLIPGFWAVVSWFWLGSALPDTLFKRYQQPWGGHSFGTGLVLLGKHYPLAVGTAVAIPLICVVALVVARIFARPNPTRSEQSARTGQTGGLLIFAGALHYAAYAVLHPPPYHWYYALSLAPITLGALVILVDRYREARWLRITVAALLGLSIAVVAMNSTSEFPPITTNWHNGDQARAMARELAEIVGDKNVGFGGEVGAIAYYCQCEVIDDFTDMANLNSGIVRSLESSTGIRHDLMRFNYHHRDLTAIPPPFQYWISVTTSPPGSRWSWRVNSPWAGTNYYGLNEVLPPSPPTG